MRAIATKWTKHLKDTQKKKDFEQALRHDTLVLGRLLELLREDLQSLENKETSSEAYECPSWAYKQADLNGAKRELKKIISLIDFIEG